MGNDQNDDPDDGSQSLVRIIFTKAIGIQDNTQLTRKLFTRNFYSSSAQVSWGVIPLTWLHE